MNLPKVLIQIDCDTASTIARFNSVQNLDSTYDYFYYKALERFLDIFSDKEQKATLFVSGKDLHIDNNIKILEHCVKKGWEIANHTYSHPTGIINMPYDKIYEEISKTDKLISQNLGYKPYGYRAPNYEMFFKTNILLSMMDYSYDCSLMPTPYKLILRWLIKNKTYLGEGKFDLKIIQPYYLDNQCEYKYNKKNKSIIEVPVSTFPRLYFPCTASYLLSLPIKIRNSMLKSILRYNEKKSATLVFIFHLIDLVENAYLLPPYSRYYGSLDERINFVKNFSSMVKHRFDTMTTIDYVKEINNTGG